MSGDSELSDQAALAVEGILDQAGRIQHLLSHLCKEAVDDGEADELESVEAQLVEVVDDLAEVVGRTEEKSKTGATE